MNLTYVSSHEKKNLVKVLVSIFFWALHATNSGKVRNSCFPRSVSHNFFGDGNERSPHLLTRTAMNTTYALQALCSCTASLSSRTLARSALYTPNRLSPMTRRHYSEEKSADASADKPTATEADKDASKVGESSECEKKLKDKEAEVTDLTVRRHYNIYSRLDADIVTSQGRLRYLQADFLNLQRNAAREKEQTRDFAITRFASDLLETVDVLSMALKSIPPSVIAAANPSSNAEASTSTASSSASSTPPTKNAEAYLHELHTGVELTHRVLLQTLFKFHVKPFDPTGDKFDPNMHEALYQAPIPGKEPGTVIDCQKMGYTIKDRVLRAAQVGVAQDIS